MFWAQTKGKLLAVALLAATPLAAVGLPISTEARVEVDVLQATTNAIVCWKSISGGDGGELFALDPALKTVLWRQPEKDGPYEAQVDGQSLFYVANGTLRKRSLTTGALAWESPWPASRNKRNHHHDLAGGNGYSEPN